MGEAVDIHITSTNMGGWGLYQIWVDGTVFTEFRAYPMLTWSQESDTLALYREALEYWRD